jgi:hypothetical protein
MKRKKARRNETLKEEAEVSSCLSIYISLDHNGQQNASAAKMKKNETGG